MELSWPKRGFTSLRNRTAANFFAFRAMPQDSAARAQSAPKPYSLPVDLGTGKSEVALVDQSCALRFTVIDWPPQGRETTITGAVLDRERLRVPLVVRNWQPGDSVRLLGHQKRHRLSRLLNELGVSRWEKATWPVLTCGGEVAWVRGLPVADDFAVGNATRKGVVISEVSLL